MNVTIVKDGKQIKRKLPTHWDNITLKQYMSVMKIISNKELKSLSRIVKVIGALTDIDEEDIVRLPVKNINTLGSVMNKFLQTKPNEDLNHIVKLDGVEYGFHPKLSNITFGEWVDIDSYITEGVNDTLHKIMAILYRPIIAKKDGKYRIQEYEPNEESQDLMLNHLTVGDFYGVSVFFSDLGKELLNHSAQSSIRELIAEHKMDKHQQEI
ncbi:MAG: hypothetical protein Unbinned4585contig1001_20 [Prokaryotic dsDNA virus sp.]|nr:MAG: hypothetical protein Unbinned4585contig1001_20 [Prokaryotic dsDNA virus sp.]|tara:strand:- start:2741 stop:3373 length:633 start_codon:yes stop_codon:yes gene_type:complete